MTYFDSVEKNTVSEVHLHVLNFFWLLLKKACLRQLADQWCRSFTLVEEEVEA